MGKIGRRRKLLLLLILSVVLGAHVALFLAGGSWRTLGLALVGVDAFSAWFVIGAIRETRKLEKKEAPES